MPGVDDVPFLTNTSMLALDRVPRHLVVVGGSYVGLEFAQMYRRFGAEVTVVEMGPRLIGARTRTSRPRSRTSSRRRASRCAPARSASASRRTRDGVAVSVDCRSGRAGGGRLARAARGRPAAEHRRPRARARRRRDRRARLHHGRRRSPRTCPASGRSATATAAAPSRTRPTTTSRSSPPTCSTATTARVERSHPRLRALHRSAARPRRHDRGARRARPDGRCSSAAGR